MALSSSLIAVWPGMMSEKLVKTPTWGLPIAPVVTPVAYSYFDDLGRLFVRKRAEQPFAAAPDQRSQSTVTS